MPVDPHLPRSLDTYAAARTTSRARRMAYRGLCRVNLGPSMRLCFEDETTPRMRARKMLQAGWLHSAQERTELAELYSRWLPSVERWTATPVMTPPMPTPERVRPCVFCRGVDRIDRSCRPGTRAFALPKADRLDRHRACLIGVHRLGCKRDADWRRGAGAGRPTDIGCDDECALRGQLPTHRREPLALDPAFRDQGRRGARLR